MDRPPHDYPAAMGFAGQPPPHYGYPPQQQFPPQGPPYMAPHPSALQQYPFSRHLAPPPQSLHHLHLQQPPPSFAAPPHGPPHMVPPHFLHPFEPGHPPAPAPPPADPELQKVIDKLVEYISKNGPEFELMIREKQHDNPAYAFLFGGEGHGYYRYKLWLASHQAPFGGPGFGGGLPSALNPILGRSSLSPAHLGAAAGHPGSMLVGPQSHQPFPPFYEQPHSQSYLGQGRADYEASKPFKGLSGPLPSDVAAELNAVLANLTGTKESIKGAKMWFMQRSPFAPALAEALREKVFALDDSERQLHIVFLANDILFDSLQRRVNPRDLDNEALAFKPVLGSMLARIYHNPHNRDANQTHLEKLLKFWASKEVYDQETIQLLETEMTGRPPRFRSETPELTHPSDSSFSGSQHGLGSQSLSKWDRQNSSASVSADQETQEKQLPGMSMPHSLYGTPGHQQPLFSGSLAVQTPSQAAALPQPAAPSAVAEQRPPPYPLFPPGLIPGMVRKMQIGSGVPYSPLSPLDIPTVIPPSTVTPSEVLARVSKFFKEIGEANPSEGPMKASDSLSIHDDYEHDEYERELAVRKGGACIPPPSNLHLDPESGTYADGSVDRKSGSGRLGLGATADPNEPSQYDDVYDSYRKQRSTNYHTSMSARSSAR